MNNVQRACLHDSVRIVIVRAGEEEEGCDGDDRLQGQWEVSTPL